MQPLVSGLMAARTAARFFSAPVEMSSFFQNKDFDKAPLPPADRLPTAWEHAVGPNRHEIIAERYGEERYFTEDVEADFGTMKNPIEIPSYNPERVVGCTGPPGMEHEVTYFELTWPETPVWSCPECEAWYTLKPILSWENINE